RFLFPLKGGGLRWGSPARGKASSPPPSSAEREPSPHANTDCGALIIDQDAIRNAANRHGDFRLARFGVDDGDVVAETVGDVERLLVVRKRNAPGALADENIAKDFARRHVDNGDMGGMAERH